MNYQNYNQPNNPYMPPYQNKPSPSGMSVASLVLGILGSTLCCGGIGIILGIVGICLGISGNKQVKTGVGTAGIVLSGVAIGLSIFALIFAIAFWGTYFSNVGSYSYYYY